jgi:hypothetical protein
MYREDSILLSLSLSLWVTSKFYGVGALQLQADLWSIPMCLSNEILPNGGLVSKVKYTFME